MDQNGGVTDTYIVNEGYNISLFCLELGSNTALVTWTKNGAEGIAKQL